MDLNQAIDNIRVALRRRDFPNEAAVSSGVVLRVLQALDWPVFDPRLVSPEYTVGGRRVDYALCDTPGRPVVFVEVKQVGQSEGADKQLFEYAFHEGIQMAILTDGQKWHFYVPGEQGAYQDRRVYMLDILERDMEEAAFRFKRYLDYGGTRSGQTLEAARQDYRDAARNKTILEKLPVAWTGLLEEPDELLVELLAEQVETLCGFKPRLDDVSAFLRKQAFVSTHAVQPTVPKPMVPPAPSPAATSSEGIGFEFMGEKRSAHSAKEVMIQVLQLFSLRDPSFLDRFAARPKHGRTRRYVSRNKMELYQQLELCNKYSEQLQDGWWVGTNYSTDQIRKILEMACEVMGFVLDRDLVVQFD